MTDHCTGTDSDTEQEDRLGEKVMPDRDPTPLGLGQQYNLSVSRAP